MSATDSRPQNQYKHWGIPNKSSVKFESIWVWLRVICAWGNCVGGIDKDLTELHKWKYDRKTKKKHVKMLLIGLKMFLTSLEYYFLMDLYSGWSHSSSWAPRYSIFNIFNIFIEIIIINGNGDTNSYQVPQREFLQKVDFLRAVTPKMFGNGISAFTLP